MKKLIFAFIVMDGCVGVTHAQSTVTLYGLVDEAVMVNTNNKQVVKGVNVGGRQISVDSSNGPQGSRWGLKGAEDLGNGLKAIFTLESGVNLSNGAFGQGNTPFGRQAFVGLSSERLGTVTLGRQYDSINDFVGTKYGFAQTSGGIPSEHPADLDNLNHTFRLNNTLKYLSPNLHGLTFGGTVSLGGVAGEVSQDSAYTFGANYANGPVGVGAAYGLYKNPSQTGGVLNDNVNASTFNSINSGYLGTNAATSLQIIVAGASYNLGAATIGGTYSNVKYMNIGAFKGATATFNTVELNSVYRFTPALSVAGAYDYTKGSAVSGNIGNQNYNQFSLIVDYSLSKRTDVYALGVFQKASGTNSTGAAAVADIGNLGDSSNPRQAILRFGMRHRF
ncbi:porin [Paraburkholderia xenovorans]|uniref:porin n=1 Tax=Paraburkholderia xenovorans TaxID=36873 RepID=UPI0038B7FB56